MSSGFRTNTFDPILIAAQIVALQTSYYLSASLVIFFIDLLTGSPVSLAQIISWTELRTDTVVGWSLFLAFVINAGIGCYSQLFLVQRAKLCLDFSTTLHFLHLVITSLYTGSLPRSFLWWLTVICTLLIMAMGGEHLCMQKEMEPIAIAGTLKRAGSTYPGGPGPSGNTADSIELQRLNDLEEGVA
ncbi:integral membrane protein S linking to the trans Golgi network-domain-containing protein [Fimicolochytrium jonesii]|uniref:integral membrane protein S linking to the trans Golgi network-domain-containing protein n=1 Tax=Fimicolochytrium jonesii TaxID=1396493 RepID=UPI0022FEFD02|nr:integral membrane protein S linking to the trans Golgi network-domain-containing protein [Fimicolochytrium jonesii]KAI8818135.1 integral membrane protein S linking to the trans Golgi network-domain-containing protein [Fimicolochytrium jonesii]